MRCSRAAAFQHHDSASQTTSSALTFARAPSPRGEGLCAASIAGFGYAGTDGTQYFKLLMFFYRTILSSREERSGTEGSVLPAKGKRILRLAGARSG